MKQTYEETLNKMRNAYFEYCGENPAESSFEERIMESLASELYGLYCYGDFILKQSFVKTATGEHLDMLGEMRDCARKSEAKAHGVLTFYNAEPAQEDIEIKKGTVCSVKGKPYIQFETTEGGVIAAGENSVELPALALASGEEYNAAAGEICVMVNAPVMAESVINISAFTGGCANESDSAYRKRILKNYTVPSNGVGKTSVENKINKLDYISDCLITDAESEGLVCVTVIMRDGEEVTAERANEIRQAIGFASITGATVKISAAQPEQVSITADLRISKSANPQEITAAAKEVIEELLCGEKIGQSVPISKITNALLKYDDIEQADIYSAAAVSGEIFCPSSSYLKLSGTAVNCYV